MAVVTEPILTENDKEHYELWYVDALGFHNVYDPTMRYAGLDGPHGVRTKINALNAAQAVEYDNDLLKGDEVLRFFAVRVFYRQATDPVGPFDR